MNKDDQYYLQKAIKLAAIGSAKKAGGPFGALVVKEDKILGQASNRVFQRQDPTAHAEIEAIRDACRNEYAAFLEGATLYSSCEPCPMCFSAIYYAKISRVVYAASHADAKEIAGFGVDELYRELERPVSERQLSHQQLMREEGLVPFREWKQEHVDKAEYANNINHQPIYKL